MLVRNFLFSVLRHWVLFWALVSLAVSPIQVTLGLDYDSGHQGIFPYYLPEGSGENIVAATGHNGYGTGYTGALRGQNTVQKIFHFGLDWLELDYVSSAVFTASLAQASANQGWSGQNSQNRCGLAAWGCQGQRWTNFSQAVNVPTSLTNQLFFIGFEFNTSFNSVLTGADSTGAGSQSQAFASLKAIDSLNDNDTASQDLIRAYINSYFEVEADTETTLRQAREILTANQASQPRIKTSQDTDQINLSQQVLHNCQTIPKSERNPARSINYEANPGNRSSVATHHRRKHDQSTAHITPTAVVDKCLAVSAAALFEDLNQSPRGAGYVLGWGYRTHSQQIYLRKQHCGTSNYDVYHKPSTECDPWVAIPGTSNHEYGQAIDFVSTHLPGGPTLRNGPPGYWWLVDNAENYGFYNLMRTAEPWHWSTTGY